MNYPLTVTAHCSVPSIYFSQTLRTFSSPSRFLLSSNFLRVFPPIFAAMASSNSDEGHGGDFYLAAPYRAREGLITRRQGNNSGEIQLEINDLEQGALDYGVTDLRGQVRKLRNVSYEIEAEAKYHHNLVKVLKLPLVRAQAALKNNSRRLNQRIVREGSDHVKHVILFAVVCIFVLYFWSKFSGIWK